MNALQNLATQSKKKTDALRFTSAPPLVDAWLEAKENAKDADARLKVAAEALTEPVREAWIRGNAGRAVPASSVLASGDTGEALVSFAGVYKTGLDEIPATLRRRKFSITVDGDVVPADKADAFAAALVELARSFGIVDAISAKVVENYPATDFDTRRFTELTPEQNLALEAAGLGTRVSIRAK